MSILQANRIQYVFHRRTMNLPNRHVHNELRCYCWCKWPSDFLRDVDIKLLQDLDAQAAVTALPEFTNQLSGARVLLPSRAVVRVDQDVCVDELKVSRLAHEAHHAGSRFGH